MSIGLRLEKVHNVCKMCENCSDCPLKNKCPAQATPSLWDVYEIDKALKDYCSCGRKKENPNMYKCYTCNRKYVHGEIAKRKEEGCCQDCGKPLESNEVTFCQRCLERRRVYNKRSREKKMKARSENES